MTLTGRRRLPWRQAAPPLPGGLSTPTPPHRTATLKAAEPVSPHHNDGSDQSTLHKSEAARRSV